MTTRNDERPRSPVENPSHQFDSATATRSQVLAAFYERPADPAWRPPGGYSDALEQGFRQNRGAIVTTLEEYLAKTGVPQALLAYAMQYLGRSYVRRADGSGGRPARRRS